ncbi:glycerol-3-phosphate dehydrogenase/oxidase [Halioxenophilus aromaticivorans]|uniref:FAD-dependent oxidoreductase n=1 Tax=Halioxenophilus aromaticivorans TaxID=1306992 RepID=A0AAV3U3H7_9ALTE
MTDKTVYDLIIAGAGIHGAAIAHQAVSNGLSVLVLEQYDRAARATSGRSSKLIHGGLRYLESFNFKLVRECLLDRQRLLEQYPDLVRMRRFFIPIYKNTNRSRFTINAGLTLYGLLGAGGKYSRHRKIPKKDWDALDGIKQDELLAVYQYWDAQTDDAKLTSRLLQEAQAPNKGPKAEVIFNASVEMCERNGDKLRVKYLQEDVPVVAHGRHFINATGPWVNDTLAKCKPSVEGLPVDLVQGTHLELPGQLKKGIYYFEAPQDKRAVFAMPWYGKILFGTTETVYRGDPAEVKPTMLEESYLLTIFNYYFPDNPVERTDVISSWAGLRVLPSSEASPFKRSRDTIFHKDDDNDPRILSIYGGKLTSHYSTAEKLLKLLR